MTYTELQQRVKDALRDTVKSYVLIVELTNGMKDVLRGGEQDGDEIIRWMAAKTAEHMIATPLGPVELAAVKDRLAALENAARFVRDTYPNVAVPWNELLPNG